MGVLQGVKLPASDLDLLTDADIQLHNHAIARRLRHPRADASCRERILRQLDSYKSDGPELAHYEAKREYLRTVIDPD